MKRRRSQGNRILAVLIVSVACVGGFVNPVGAQDSDTGNQTLYTFAFVRVPLLDALEVVMRETSIDLFFETELVAGRYSFCSINRKTQENVLRCVIDDTGLDFIRLSSGAYVLIPATVSIANYGVVRGTIQDRDTGLPVSDANVILAGSNLGTSTTRSGYFVLPRVVTGSHQIVVTHVAYHDTMATIVVGPRQPQRIDLSVSPRIILSKPIIVDGISRKLPFQALGSTDDDATSIRQTPGGSVDVTSALRSVAGIEVSDALSTIHVQGGDAGENEFRLDGVPVFMPLSNGGFVGPFSPFAIGRITLHKAGLEASEGSVLSGVVAVDHEVSGEPMHGTLQLGPLSVSGRVGGNLTDGNTRIHWMAAGRRSFWSLIRNRQLSDRLKTWSAPDPFLLDTAHPDSALGTSLASLFTEGNVELKFSDIHSAVQINRGLQQIYMSFYTGSNVFGNDALEADPVSTGAVGDEYVWFNAVATLEYDRVLHNRLLGYLKLWKSSYRLRHPFNYSPLSGGQDSISVETARGEFNEIETIGLRGQLDAALGARHAISAAIESSIVDDDFAISLDPRGVIAPVTSEIYPTSKWKWTGLLQDDISLGYGLTLVAGSRLTYVPVQQKVYAEPRLSLRRDVQLEHGRVLALRVATGLYRQYLNQFDIAPYTVSAILPSFRFWVPLGKDSSAPLSVHLASEGLLTFSPVWHVRAEAYYKHSPHINVINYSDVSNPERSFLESGTSHAYGAGFTVGAEKLPVGGQLSYTYSQSRLSIPGRFDSRSVKAPWSIPHQLRLVTNLRSGSWFGTVRVRSAFGRSWGFRQGYYDYLEPLDNVTGIFDFSTPGNDKLPTFVQIDAGAGYATSIRGAKVEVNLNVLNVIDRDNVVDWQLEFDEVNATYRRSNRSGIPFTTLFSTTISL